MKQIKISKELFVQLIKYHVLEMDTDVESIKNNLEMKLDAMVMHELYTKYKTAPSDAEKEKARQEYLDKRGVLDSFRW